MTVAMGLWIGETGWWVSALIQLGIGLRAAVAIYSACVEAPASALTIPSQRAISQPLVRPSRTSTGSSGSPAMSSATYRAREPLTWRRPISV